MNESTATMNDLPPEVMKNIFGYVGKGNFCFLGLVSKDFCYDYLTLDVIEDRNAHKLNFMLALDRNKLTTVDAASSSLDVGNNKRKVTNDGSSNHAKIVERQKKTYAAAVKAQNEECVKEMKQHVTAASSH